MLTISFYSYKGGVGRSLALANLGVYLAQFGMNVVMIDFDLEAPGLQYKFQPNSPIEVGEKSLVSLLGKATSNIANLSTSDLEIEIDLSNLLRPPRSASDDLALPVGRLYLVPAGNPQKLTYWRELAEIDWTRAFTGRHRPGVAAMTQLRRYLLEKLEPDVLLVDSRTGITPIGGVSTTLLPDTVVVMFLNTREHLDGIKTVVSAITRSERPDGTAPKVVPVLSRYGSPMPAIGSTLQTESRYAREDADEDQGLRESSVLGEVANYLRLNLESPFSDRIADTLILHSDAALQRREQLSFGPFRSVPEDGGVGRTLLSDYLKLFADIVPSDTFLDKLDQIRNRIRGIIMDRPDDAVRSIEDLAAIVERPEILIDLVKAHLLRRDSQESITAAKRLFAAHGQIYADLQLAHLVRTGTLRASESTFDLLEFSPEFSIAYWEQVIPIDVEWGIAILKWLLHIGEMKGAELIAIEIVEASRDASALTSVIALLVEYGTRAEALAIDISLKYFELGRNSEDFIRMAVNAWSRQPNADLGEAILNSGLSEIPGLPAAIDILVSIGRFEDAKELMLKMLAGARPDDPLLVELATSWRLIVARGIGLRSEMQSKNPQIAAALDAIAEGSSR